ncbi:MAG: phage protease [Phycisphaerae bacterium]|nr:phage protease [Phycisphaerae bacterium]
MKRKRTCDSAAGVSALHALAQARIVERLRSATRLARAGVDGNCEALSELLRDALDRVSACRTVGEVVGGALVSARQHGKAAVAEAAPPAEPEGSEDGALTDEPLQCDVHAKTAFSGRAALASDFGAPVNEFLLIPFGEVMVERPLAGRSFHFTRDHAEAATAWFAGLARPLAIDYEHQSIGPFNTREDGLRPAAGWIGGLETRSDGLWATDVRWTARAAELIGSGEYRFFSPVIYWSDEEYSQLISLGPVALTNDPAMHGVSALAAARREIDDLRRQLQSQAADAFVERGMRLGKIVDATSIDWREDYRRDPQAAEVRLSRAPVLRPPGRVLSVDPRGRALSLGDAPAAPGSAASRSTGVEPADLAAFERARAAGRVRIG